MKQIEVSSKEKTDLINITREIQSVLAESGIESGICHIFVPHTTAAVTINEAADPAVARDIKMELNKIVPFQDGYKHMEGNSAAHIKASLVGPAVCIPIENGRPALGTWQGIYFCEFDGPRRRKVGITTIPAS
ncbi:MAG: secondary thiamine-phosphate synthase enzyme YjbQ [Spirochaetales bacterium]|nr:secondary thiamine-phosphate synthase enzyme YjbQ [Spirochaetales bacterium]MCF7938695.1 secondary thiamine-phosphate synthase enzyme YjbQ [Spirochaetales bacterium]